MDQHTAQVLFQEGAFFICLDVPEMTEFGIDYYSWRSGPNFRGIKMIPPGIHFVYFSASNKEGQTAPRTGFFHNFKPKEIVVRRWDTYTEDMTSDKVTCEDMERIAGNLKEMDRYLGPYPYDIYKKWVSMTKHITESVLDHILPDNKRISSVTEFESASSTSQSRLRDIRERHELNSDLPCSSSKGECLPEMKVKAGTAIRYSPICKVRYPPGATPSEITRYSIDSSYMLEKILSEIYPICDLGLLGEIQFAFVCFIVGQHYDSFEQWKKLVNLLCTSEESLNNHTELFLQMVTVLHFQIKDIPEDFFVDIVSQDNFLTSTLQQFFSNVEASVEDETLKRRGRSFCDHLTEKFKWDFMSEPDDCSPVVVQDY